MNLSQIKLRCRECGDCWEFITNAKTAHHRRHPQINIGGKPHLVRRLAFELWQGKPIRPGRSIMPDCGNPRCVSPEHQVEVSESQKGSRAAKTGAFSRPERGAKIAAARRVAKFAKLTMEDARAIRASTEPGPAIAARYGVNNSLVSGIRRGQRWKEYGADNPFAGLLA